MTGAAEPQPLTLAALADKLDATLIGDGAIAVRGVAHPAAATEDMLALGIDDGGIAALNSTRARAAVVPAGREAGLDGLAAILAVERPRLALAVLLDLFAPPTHRWDGVHPSAVVDGSARVGSGVSIGAHAYVGPGAEIGENTTLLQHVTVGAGARLGQRCLLHAGARVGERVVLGDGVILQSNASIGADGFSYVTPQEGSIESARKSGEITARNVEIVRINSIGTVILGDDVEVGANSAIDRATIGATTVGRGTKIDNLVQIGHNCTIGENCLIAGRVGISGSVRIGDRVVLAGGVGVADHLTIGDDAIIMAGSGVGSGVPKKAIACGYPARPREEFLGDLLNIRRLTRVIRDIKELKKRLAAIERGDG